MEDILKQILSELKSTNDRLNKIDGRLDSMDNRLDSMDDRLNNLDEKLFNIELEVKEVNRKTGVIFEQTVDLSEFKTSTAEALNKIESDVEFLTHKETQTEKAIFNIERKFSANR